MPADILVAKASFFYEHDGVSVMVPKGATVRAGHPVLDGRGDMFAPVGVDFDVDEVASTAVEQATAAPGEVRELPKRRGRPPKTVVDGGDS